MKKRVQLTILFFTVTFLVSAQLNVLPLGQVQLKNQTVINSNSNNPADGMDVTGNNANLPDGCDLIWGYYGATQSNKVGLLTMQSVDGACFSVRANGRVGIFNHDPSVALEIGSAGSNEQLKINGTLVIASDERIKTNIKAISNSLDQLKQLRSVSYTIKDTTETQITTNSITTANGEIVKPAFKKKVNTEEKNRNHYGFLAQEVQQVFPDLVYKDKAGMLGVDYVGLIPLMIDALKEQKAMIDAQAKQIQALINAIEKKK
jgi:hypothetical protein